MALKTVTATIRLSFSANGLFIVIMDFSQSENKKIKSMKNTKTVPISFDTSNTNDVCQLNKLLKFTGTSSQQFPNLTGKEIRLIIDTTEPKHFVKGIGELKKDSFYLTTGMGLLMSEEVAYQKIEAEEEE